MQACGVLIRVTCESLSRSLWLPVHRHRHRRVVDRVVFDRPIISTLRTSMKT